MFSARPPKQGDDTLKVLKESARVDVEIIIAPPIDRENPPRDYPGNISAIEDVFDELDTASGPCKATFVKASFKKTPGAQHHRKPALDGSLTIDPDAPHKEHVRNPWAIWRVSDLFAQCGPLLSLFVMAQIASAVYVAVDLAAAFGQERAFLIGMLLLAAFVADGVTFALFRGRLLAGFKLPAVILALVTMVPGAVLRAWNWWSDMHPPEGVIP